LNPPRWGGGGCRRDGALCAPRNGQRMENWENECQVAASALLVTEIGTKPHDDQEERRREAEEEQCRVDIEPGSQSGRPKKTR